MGEVPGALPGMHADCLVDNLLDLAQQRSRADCVATMFVGDFAPACRGAEMWCLGRPQAILVLPLHVLNDAAQVVEPVVDDLAGPEQRAGFAAAPPRGLRRVRPTPAVGTVGGDLHGLLEDAVRALVTGVNAEDALRPWLCDRVQPTSCGSGICARDARPAMPASASEVRHVVSRSRVCGVVVKGPRVPANRG